MSRTAVLPRPRSEARELELERQLRASEERFAAFVDGVRDHAFCLLDPAGRIVHWNAGAERSTGYALHEALGQHVALLHPPEEVQRRQPQHDLAQAAAGHCEREHWCLRRDGTRVWARVTLRALRDDAGRLTGFARVTRDVTELRQAEGALRETESRLRQAAKMEAVGQLAGGVAHDFNNLLTTVGGHAQLLLRRLAADDPLRRSAEQIERAAERAAELTRQLLAVGRKQVLQPRMLSLNAVAVETAGLVQRVLGAHVQLCPVLDPGLAPVRADPVQVGQVLLNLVVNARDAMPDGGTITIETRNVWLPPGSVREGLAVEPGTYAVLAVSDTGDGMSRDVQAHVFEPFFTTKAAGGGTGLGLATAYGIVKQSGGYIWVTSEVGRGTTFEVYLPAAPWERVPDVAAAPPDAAPPAPVGGRETVLLAEDDPAVRAFVREVLADAGYTVLAAATAVEALEAALAHEGPVHLLLADVVMPGGSGRQLAAALDEVRPGARVLYMSGYADHTMFRHGLLDAGTPFLQKPFAPDAVAAKVREVLDG